MKPDLSFDPPLVTGRFIRRYKRFFADVRLDSGEEVTAHCANTGAMTSCLAEGWPVALSPAGPGRKLAYSLELSYNSSSWIGVHTARANRLVENWLAAGRLPEFAGLPFSREKTVTVNGQTSRFDFQLLADDGQALWLEVKTVTLLEDTRLSFPDAVTARGLKHVEHLAALAAAGSRAWLVFVILREDGRNFSLAGHIDRAYEQAVEQALAAGLNIMVCRASVGLRGFGFKRRVLYSGRPVRV